MIGTFLNAAGVLVGGGLGLCIGHLLPKSLQDSLMKTTGLCVLFLGLSGTLTKMQEFPDTSLMVILCMAFGVIVGEILNIEQRFDDFGSWLKEVTKNDRDSDFVDAFVTTSLTICIGAMAIVGSITEGLTGDYSILAAKAVLDLLIVLIVTATKGKGALFSAIPILLLQGSITLLAQLLSPIMTDLALAYISLLGSMMIFCVGVNLFWGKMIKVANLLPALVFAVLWALFL